MLELIVTDITRNSSGPVVHLTEPTGGAAKIELYLPAGYDVPGLGDRFSLDRLVSPQLGAAPLVSGSEPSTGDAPASTSELPTFQ